jgi:hypothetical protein
VCGSGRKECVFKIYKTLRKISVEYYGYKRVGANNYEGKPIVYKGGHMMEVPINYDLIHWLIKNVLYFEDHQEHLGKVLRTMGAVSQMTEQIQIHTREWIGRNANKNIDFEEY